MIDHEWAETFANEWIDAFNAHDIERILDLYSDDFTMRFPYIQERMGIDEGVLVGKTAVRPYWAKSLKMEPPLRFELINTYVGASTVIVHYRNVDRKLVCETFTFNEQGKVTSGCSQHGPLL